VTIQAITCVLQWWTLKQSARRDGIKPNWKECWTERGTLLGFSVPALINSSLNAPVNWLCITLLLNYGGGFPEMGLLQVANVWFLAVLFVSGKLAQVYFPLLEELISQGEDGQAQRLVWKFVRYNAAAFSFGALAITLLARFILQAYGPQYAAAAPALVITAWTAAVVAASQPFAVFLVVKSRMWQVVLTSVVWASLNGILAWSLVAHGAVGITAARLAAYIGSSALVISLATHLLKSGSATNTSIPTFAQSEAA
jgi:O-antigen/teichoic acid export membrane protein